jgi:hypothetical protein
MKIIHYTLSLFLPRYYNNGWKRVQCWSAEFDRSGDFKLILQANRLRSRISKSYEIRIKIGREAEVFYMRPEVDYRTVEQFTIRSKGCKSFAEVELLYKEYTRYAC